MANETIGDSFAGLAVLCFGYAGGRRITWYESLANRFTEPAIKYKLIEHDDGTKSWEAADAGGASKS